MFGQLRRTRLNLMEVQSSKTTKRLRITALILLIFLGISAFFGGIGMIMDPSGESMQMPLSLLNGTPFDNFLIPGIILLVCNGILSLLFAWMLIRRRRSYPLMVVAQGFILLIWLSTELIMNIEMYYPPLHWPYFANGIALVLVGFWLWRKEQS